MDANKVFLGNVPWVASEGDLRALIAPFGRIVKLNLVVDRETQRSKGFAFVEMDSPETAQAVIAALHGKTFLERKLVADHARPKAGK